MAQRVTNEQVQVAYDTPKGNARVTNEQVQAMFLTADVYAGTARITSLQMQVMYSSTPMPGRMLGTRVEV